MSNKVLITNSQKAIKVPSGLRILIRRACNAVLEYEHFDAPAEISVTFVDNAAIAELNNQYRNNFASCTFICRHLIFLILIFFCHDKSPFTRISLHHSGSSQAHPLLFALFDFLPLQIFQKPFLLTFQKSFFPSLLH